MLHHKTVSRYRPDYFASVIRKWRWLIYPWAIMEDISGFLGHMEPRPHDLESAAMKLQQEHGLRLSKQTLEDVFFFSDTLPSADTLVVNDR